jgi:hypothetical protein
MSDETLSPHGPVDFGEMGSQLGPEFSAPYAPVPWRTRARDWASRGTDAYAHFRQSPGAQQFARFHQGMAAEISGLAGTAAAKTKHAQVSFRRINTFLTRRTWNDYRRGVGFALLDAKDAIVNEFHAARWVWKRNPSLRIATAAIAGAVGGTALGHQAGRWWASSVDQAAQLAQATGFIYNAGNVTKAAIGVAGVCWGINYFTRKNNVDPGRPMVIAAISAAGALAINLVAG